MVSMRSYGHFRTQKSLSSAGFEDSMVRGGDVVRLLPKLTISSPAPDFRSELPAGFSRKRGAGGETGEWLSARRASGGGMTVDAVGDE
jgi:hypothetical protein